MQERGGLYIVLCEAGTCLDGPGLGVVACIHCAVPPVPASTGRACVSALRTDAALLNRAGPIKHLVKARKLRTKENRRAVHLRRIRA